MCCLAATILEFLSFAAHSMHARSSHVSGREIGKFAHSAHFGDYAVNRDLGEYFPEDHQEKRRRLRLSVKSGCYANRPWVLMK